MPVSETIPKSNSSSTKSPIVEHAKDMATDAGTVSEGENADNLKDLKDLQSKITLIFHAVRFPDLTMPHKPEMFGINDQDFNRKAMSLGRMKLFPDEVLKEVFSNLKDSPIHKLRLIRSKLQSYVDQYTFSFMHGMSRAIPNEKLKEFREIIGSLENEFDNAFTQYESKYDAMIEASKKYWADKADIYHITEKNLILAINNQFKSFESLRNKFLFDVTHFAINNPSNLDTNHINSEQLAVIEARNEVIKETKTKLKHTCNQFIIEARSELRARLSFGFNTLLRAVKEGKFNQKSINSVIKLLDEFKKLNITEDSEIEGCISQWMSSMKSQTAQNIKDESALNAEFKTYLEEQIAKIEKLQEDEVDKFQQNFGEIVDRDIDPF